LKKTNDHNTDLLTRKQHEVIKEFKYNEDIIIIKADKRNTFVIMKK
jgi:hypothetical protein